MKFVLVALSLVAAPLTFCACASVKPYEREWLSHPGMQLDAESDPESVAEQHQLESREGSSGGYGSVGGGCGCN